MRQFMCDRLIAAFVRRWRVPVECVGAIASVRRSLQLLLKLLHLRLDHQAAIGLVPVVAVVVLVVVFGFEELFQRHNLGDDWLEEVLLDLRF